MRIWTPLQLIRNLDWLSHRVAECALLTMRSMKWFSTGLKSRCPRFAFSPWSVSPTAARYLLGRHCVSRLPCASRRGTAKYVGTPEWRMGRSATPGSFTSTTTPAAHLNANSKNVRSAGKKFNNLIKFYKVARLVHFQHIIGIVGELEKASGWQSQMCSLPQWQKQPLLQALQV